MVLHNGIDLLLIVLTVRNPGGKKTPQESAVLTPDVIQNLANITTLIESAVYNRNQAALKKLVRHRSSGYYHDGLSVNVDIFT